VSTTQNQLELKIDAKLENLWVIANFVATSMKRLGIKEGVFEAQLAVDEACTNIVKYAYSSRGGIITVTCELKGRNFVVTIRDRGRSFDPASIPLPDLDSDLDKRKVGGLGIYMMRKLMDDINYSFDAKKGNTLVMRKQLTSKEPGPSR
jgi:anti-sigma regulatory factor (Ser/Thr protein kinase)